jgi:hypothetical protein
MISNKITFKRKEFKSRRISGRSLMNTSLRRINNPIEIILSIYSIKLRR